MDIPLLLFYLFIIYSSGFVFLILARSFSFHQATFLIPWGMALASFAFSYPFPPVFTHAFLKGAMSVIVSLVLFFYGLRWKLRSLPSSFSHHLSRYFLYYLLSFFGVAFLLFSLFSFQYLWGILIIASLIPLVETNYRNETHFFYAETLASSLFFFLPLLFAALMVIFLQGNAFLPLLLTFLAKIFVSVFFAFVAAFSLIKKERKRVKQNKHFPLYSSLLVLLFLYVLVSFFEAYPFLSSFLYGFLLAQYLPYRFPSSFYYQMEDHLGIFIYTLLGIIAGRLLPFSPIATYILFFLFLIVLRFLLSLFFYGHHHDPLKNALFLTLGATKTLGVSTLVLYFYSLQFPYSLLLLSLLSFFIFFHALFFDVLNIMGIGIKRDDP